MPDLTGKTFDESNLRNSIVSVWGEHGAHIDVFDFMVKEIDELRHQVETCNQERYRVALERIAKGHDPNQGCASIAQEALQSPGRPDGRS